MKKKIVVIIMKKKLSTFGRFAVSASRDVLGFKAFNSDSKGQYDSNYYEENSNNDEENVEEEDSCYYNEEDNCHEDKPDDKTIDGMFCKVREIAKNKILHISCF